MKNKYRISAICVLLAVCVSAVSGCADKDHATTTGNGSSTVTAEGSTALTTGTVGTTTEGQTRTDPKTIDFTAVTGSVSGNAARIRIKEKNTMAVADIPLEGGRLEATFTIPSTGSVGFTFGGNKDNYYYYALGSDKSVALYRVSGKNEKLIKKTSLVAKYGAGATVNLSLVTNGNTVWTYIDGVCLVMRDKLEFYGNECGVRSDAEGAVISKISMTNRSVPEKADIVIWGHSHMQLWKNYASHLKGRGTVVNMGIGGSDTPYWVQIADEVSSYGADTMIVMSGSNDLPNTTPSVTMRYVKRAFDLMRSANPKLKIIMITEWLQPKRLELADEVNEYNNLLALYQKENSDWFTLVDAYDIVLLPDGSLNKSIFIDVYHINDSGYETLQKRINDALDGKYKYDPDIKPVQPEDPDVLYNVGSPAGIRIDTDAQGNKTYTSLLPNQLIMFKNIEFTGGTIEFDMTVNATADEHFYKCSNGVIFGADTLEAGHNFGHYYVFGRCPWGSMTGYSKDSPDFLWEDNAKGKIGIAVGEKQHYKFVWDSEKYTVSMYVDGVLAATNQLTRHFNGSYVGIYFDAAGTVISGLSFSENK